MPSRLNFFYFKSLRLLRDGYHFVHGVADYHFMVIEGLFNWFFNFLKPFFKPFSRFFIDNYPLKAYIVYLCTVLIILGLPLYWQPYFIYIFFYFEFFAFIFSAVFPYWSFFVRRLILLFFAWLAYLEVYFDCDALFLLSSATEFFGFSDSCTVLGTSLCLAELVDGLHFWLYYFAVFYAPYMALYVALLAPFVSSVYAFSFGFLIGYRLIGFLSSFFIFLSFVSSSYILLFYPVYRQEFLNFVNWAGENMDSYFCYGGLEDLVNKEMYNYVAMSDSLNVYIDLGVFIDTPFLFSTLEFGVDSVSAIFIFIVTFISFLVHLYSIEYMQNDPHTVRFFGFLSFFTFAMLVLVTAADMIVLFIGWEGVGLSSFLLISFWYTRVPALKSALKAILMNKIGDMFLLFAIVIMGYFAGGDMSITLSCDNLIQDLIDPKITLLGFTPLDFTAVLLTLAAFVKSAQLFFHTWLPDAMEGPTPVSALLHAATMVTAGVYLIIKFSYIIEFSYTARLLMLVVASWTLIVTSLIALFQYDIKKIIAYSTCGQLAIMFISCSLSGYDYALYHFFNHAFFKCLLFLLAGLIIHELKNEQDIRMMGNLSSVMPYTFYAFTLAMVSSLGFPFLSGAASKDLILALLDEKIVEVSWGVMNTSFFNIFYLLYFIKIRFAIVALTSLYMLRLYYYVFLCFPNHRKNIFNKPNYVEPIARSPLYSFVVTVLVLLSIASGKIFRNFFVFTECNYIDIHNDILTLNTDTMHIACTFNFHYITHITLFCILGCAFYYFSWLRKNGHVSFLLTVFNFLRLYNHSVAHDITVISVLEEWDEKEREKFLWHFVRPLDWSIKLFWFFNKRCYFDDIYNYFIVYTVVMWSNYLRLIGEKGFFIFLADQLSTLSRKIVSMSGYVMVKGFMPNFFFIIITFAVLWFSF